MDRGLSIELSAGGGEGSEFTITRTGSSGIFGDFSLEIGISYAGTSYSGIWKVELDEAKDAIFEDLDISSW